MPTAPWPSRWRRSTRSRAPAHAGSIWSTWTARTAAPTITSTSGRSCRQPPSRFKWVAVDGALVQRLVARHGTTRLAVGIDAKDGRVAPRGTADILDLTARELATRVARLG